MLPAVATATFNRDPENVLSRQRKDHETNLRDWLGGRRAVPMTEEIIDLGSYGRTLTILISETYADEGDEDEDLEKRWTPRFR